MLPTRTATADRATSALESAWLPRVLIWVSYVFAAALNARALVATTRPGIAGVVASSCFVAAWLAYAARAGRCRECRGLRRMAMYWAVTIGGTAICGTLLPIRISSTGAANPGNWVMPAIVLLIAAPLYGLAGWFTTDPLAVLVAVAVGAAVLTIVVALLARRHSPASVRVPRVASGRTGLSPE